MYVSLKIVSLRPFLKGVDKISFSFMLTISLKAADTFNRAPQS